MGRQFNVLQIGGRDLKYLFDANPTVTWNYFDTSRFDNASIEKVTAVIEAQGAFDLVFVQTPFIEPMETLFTLVSTPYNTIVDHHEWQTGYAALEVVEKYRIRPINYTDEADLHDKLIALSFPGQYGDKISPAQTQTHTSDAIHVTYYGHKSVRLEGDFGETFRPVLSWRQNLIYDKDKVIEVWPEFYTEGDVALEYVVRLVSLNPEEGVLATFVLSERTLAEPLYLSRRPYTAYIAIAVRARYSGVVHIGAVHKRLSRIEFGQLLLGGERFVDERREEFFYYFNPGDFKPPLNVYFSGYREAEGFEAYYLMQQLGAPFLLISDPRIQGGAFYLGSPTYENGIKQVIQQTLDTLGFQHNACIFSGLSMGSFGALYYGAQLRPKAINVGKPLVNIGTIAQNMKLLRPLDFETSLDIVLAHQSEAVDPDTRIARLNQKFWDVLTNSNLQHTSIALTYMMHDDYDQTAFHDLLPVFGRQHVHVMNKAIPGRHNDDTATVVNWFMNFYHILLKDHFGRDVHAN
ncbi:accessory Sec system protein Asp2 [Staphylococcus delphini]|uniref:Accessory Sec system protein Asp2 n=1 Tax=Staphylococcus delphini TaxID=53344 RepID=A0A2A4GYZ8_9STAP|nr:accessory Sec system protein Asp2 [Staphylococcus delphini]PCF56783.1 accessory Sec system protein Asp2 [Staphylococcus delphini]PCF62950.1 accessory Sec system protein Asp2 [Staphylococcus delphini]PCF72653.1 accessory Sec system protein Asp2 [Staphylococcus delphini]HEC2157874.1 accessory Sec system protein Asp2 [Staphylococcus delphini]